MTLEEGDSLPDDWLCPTCTTADSADYENEDDSDRTCLCNEDKPGEKWVSCDHPRCPTIWYHATCVGFDNDSVPIDTWFCADCGSEE